ncbi:lantibiotic dehydratase family protein [uncultured Flavobacterium sp.]|uniref:lantibiotic dehydratase family protein n=1 Tax=uncultured Flavobacterium sp. TaxID=165435 RepID=UPI0030C87B9B
MNNISYFNTYVLRTSTLPISFYTSLLEDYSSQKLCKTVEKSIVKNAIKLASPELIQELEKHNQNPSIYSKEKATNLELSLLKYIARMSSRATPFGLFAGCTTGNIADETNILLSNELYTHTQFDMQFWIALVQKLSQNKSLQKQLLYFPNTSLYSIGDFYRYVEYKYVDNKREHSISSVRKNLFLEIIIDKSKLGLNLEDLANLIIDSESEKEEAIVFIGELINNQILVNNLEATVTGKDEVERVIEILKNTNVVDKKYKTINEINKVCKSLKQPHDFNNKNITFIHEKIKELEIDFEEKYLLQSDLYTKTVSHTLSKSNIQKLNKAIAFLGNIQELYPNQNLENFKNAFQKRYENKEMPLALVLDTVTGIGYLQNLGINDSHPILDKFNISRGKSKESTENWTSNEYILEHKLQTCISNKETFINLKEEDFKNIDSKTLNLPSTFSAMIEIINQKDKEVLILDSLGNFSASKLIGRFCNGNSEINNLANQIIEKETLLNENVVLAEIAHIPESRTGNILRRPVLRAYEIPYLSNSTLPIENQIEINDLTISVKHNKIVLKSTKLNKEIIPCLSNAHNYTNNTLPIYQFLCELQGQKSNPVYKFNWGILKNHYTYFPRVIYQDVILSKARWLISETELKSIKTFNDFENWRIKKLLPKYVNIVKGDNTLLLDLEKEICYNLLKKEMNNKITLEEFLFTDSSVVKDEQKNDYVNQFIISYYSN